MRDRQVTLNSVAMANLDDVLRALSDQTRRDLFLVLVRGPGLSTARLAARTDSMSRWGVMKHLAVLRNAGLIQTMAEGRHRRHYPEASTLRLVRQWLEVADSAAG